MNMSGKGFLDFTEALAYAIGKYQEAFGENPTTIWVHPDFLRDIGYPESFQYAAFFVESDESVEYGAVRVG